MICSGCGKENASRAIGYCYECIIKGKAKEISSRIERRKEYGLVDYPPKEGNSPCPFCGNSCKPLKGYGWCGERFYNGEKWLGGEEEAHLVWYYDPIPTNCVAAWFCQATKKEKGKYNLAVFYESCSFDCLFCQNWHWREGRKKFPVSYKKLAEKVVDEVACICFFGGDPSSNIKHTILVSEEALKRKKVRICWETNGNIKRDYLLKIAEIAEETEGIIKFDIKAYSDELYKVLCGVSGKLVYKNFEILAETLSHLNPPRLCASTLLIPYYVNEEEVKNIAGFIAKLNPSIPYSLLAFYPSYLMDDLPCTSKEHAFKALKYAKEAGLKNVNIGNIHLLF